MAIMESDAFLPTLCFLVLNRARSKNDVAARTEMLSIQSNQDELDVVGEEEGTDRHSIRSAPVPSTKEAYLRPRRTAHRIQQLQQKVETLQRERRKRKSQQRAAEKAREGQES